MSRALRLSGSLSQGLSAPRSSAGQEHSRDPRPERRAFPQGGLSPAPPTRYSRRSRQEGPTMKFGDLYAGALLAIAAGGAAASPAPAPTQREADGYTRYELLAPGSGTFRIVYEISATTPGATAYCNPIRPGSVASDERVSDRATGKPLRWRVVDAAAAARACGVRDAEPALKFIQVDLARPVPPGGGAARVLIDKTYQDPK